MVDAAFYNALDGQQFFTTLSNVFHGHSARDAAVFQLQISPQGKIGRRVGEVDAFGRIPIVFCTLATVVEEIDAALESGSTVCQHYYELLALKHHLMVSGLYKDNASVAERQASSDWFETSNDDPLRADKLFYSGLQRYWRRHTGDTKRADSYMYYASQMGHPTADVLYGDRLLEGRFYEKALDFYRIAADLGNPIGHHMIGTLLESYPRLAISGRPDTASRIDALFERGSVMYGHFCSAARLGHVHALVEAGHMTRDRTSRFTYYMQAASQGSAEGQYQTGKAYYERQGLTKDAAVLACAYFMDAAKQGHEKAIKALDRFPFSRLRSDALEALRTHIEGADGLDAVRSRLTAAIRGVADGREEADASQRPDSTSSNVSWVDKVKRRIGQFRLGGTREECVLLL